MFYRIKYRWNKWKASATRALFFGPPLRPARRVLIVKNDAIGDYVLVRNFVHDLKRLPGFSDCEFYLACSRRLQPIVQALDPGFYTSFFTIDFELGTEGAMDFYRSLRKLKFRYLLHPTFSPDPRAQSIVRFSNAPQRIGFDGDTMNCSAADKTFYDRFYTRLIRLEDRTGHEFLKQKSFFSELANESSPLMKPTIGLQNKDAVGSAVVVCPGAQQRFRIWDPAHYGQLLDEILEKSDLRAKIITGPGEDWIAEAILKSTKQPLEWIANPGLNDLLAHLAGAHLVVCNDSAPAHLAVALGLRSVCISNGNCYKRFVPYPESCAAAQITVVPAPVRDDERAGGTSFYNGSTLDINTVDFNEVLDACRTQLR